MVVGDVAQIYERPCLLVEPFVAATRMVVSEVKEMIHANLGVRLPLASHAAIRGLE